MDGIRWGHVQGERDCWEIIRGPDRSPHLSGALHTWQTGVTGEANASVFACVCVRRHSQVCGTGPTLSISHSTNSPGSNADILIRFVTPVLSQIRLHCLRHVLHV